MMGFEVDPITPELVLVDDELAAFARRSLPLPGDCLAVRVPAPASGASPLGGAARLARPSTIGVAAALCVVSLIGLPSRDWLPLGRSARTTNAGESSAASETASPAGSYLPAGTSPVLRWPAVPTADFYDLVLLRTGAHVLTLRVTADHVKPVELAKSQGKRLAPGSYSWFVVPVVSRGDIRQAGDVLASGGLLVAG